MDWVYKGGGLQFDLFSPQHRAADSCCGFDSRTGRHIDTHQVSFISHILLNIPVSCCFFVYQCQILSFGHWSFRTWLFECVYFLCPQWLCWACSHIMCRLFSVCVPAIQDNVSVATSVELEWCFIHSVALKNSYFSRSVWRIFTSQKICW